MSLHPHTYNEPMSGDDRSSFEGYVKRLKKAGFPQQQSEALAARYVVVRDALSVPAEVEPAPGKTGLQALPEEGSQRRSSERQSDT